MVRRRAAGRAAPKMMMMRSGALAHCVLLPSAPPRVLQVYNADRVGCDARGGVCGGGAAHACRARCFFVCWRGVCVVCVLCVGVAVCVLCVCVCELCTCHNICVCVCVCVCARSIGIPSPQQLKRMLVQHTHLRVRRVCRVCTCIYVLFFLPPWLRNPLLRARAPRLPKPRRARGAPGEGGRVANREGAKGGGRFEERARKKKSEAPAERERAVQINEREREREPSSAESNPD